MNWAQIFLGQGFESHMEHFYDKPVLAWTIIVANILIALAYFSISIGLVYFIKRRGNSKYHQVLWFFVAFIFACGIHHTIHVVTFWFGVYYLQGFVDVLTAIISIVSATVLWYCIPIALQIPTSSEHADVKREIEQTQSELISQKLQEEKQKKFISMVAHELRTPLSSQLLFADMLYMKAVKEGLVEYTEHLETVRRQSYKLTKLVKDLLEVLSHEGGTISYYFSFFDLNDMVQEVVHESRIVSPKHFIKVKGAVRRQVWADRDRIAQVLSNLLSNAIKYSPAAKKVLVTLKEDEGFTRVCVQDFGIGMDSEHHKKIFEQFYRVQNGDISNTIPGMGIGLYISSQIVKRHDGIMDVVSEEGKGSTFCFSLPRTRTPEGVLK